MLLTRYNNIDYVLEMDWIDTLELINTVLEKQNEQREWEMWVACYPNMNKETFISFEKFRDKIQAEKQVKNQSNSHLTAEEIIEKAEEIRKLHQGIHEGVKNNGDF